MLRFFMKNLFKISVILLLCIFLSSCFARENDLKPRADAPSYTTIDGMLQYAYEDIEKTKNKNDLFENRSIFSAYHSKTAAVKNIILSFVLRFPTLLLPASPFRLLLPLSLI